MFIGLKTLPIQKNRYVRQSFKFAGKVLSLVIGAEMGAVAVKIEVFYIRNTCSKMFVAMRPILLKIILILLALSLPGCGGSRSPLVGTWEIETSEEAAQKAAKIVFADEEDFDSSDLVASWLEDRIGDSKSAGKMFLTFKANGTLITETDFAMVPKGTHEGTWKLISEELLSDGQKKITVACYLKGDNFQTQVTMIGDDSIVLVPPNLVALEREMMFRRKK